MDNNKSAKITVSDSLQQKLNYKIDKRELNELSTDEFVKLAERLAKLSIEAINEEKQEVVISEKLDPDKQDLLQHAMQNAIAEKVWPENFIQPVILRHNRIVDTLKLKTPKPMPGNE